jgi:hypothetical protein
MVDPWEVLSEVWEHLPCSSKMLRSRPSRAVLEIQEHPPPILKTVRTPPPPRRCCRRSGAAITYLEDVDDGPLRGDIGDSRAPPPPPTYIEDVDGGPGSTRGLKTCIGGIDRSNSTHESLFSLHLVLLCLTILSQLTRHG